MLSNDNILKGANKICYKRAPIIVDNTLILDEDFNYVSNYFRDYNLAFDQVNDVVYFSSQSKTYQFSIKTNNLMTMNVIERPLPTNNVLKQVICGGNIFLRNYDTSILILDRYNLQQKNFIKHKQWNILNIIPSYDGESIYALVKHPSSNIMRILKIYTNGTYTLLYSINHATINDLDPLQRILCRIVSTEYGLIFYYDGTNDQHYLHYLDYNGLIISETMIDEKSNGIYYHNNYLYVMHMDYTDPSNIYKVTQTGLIYVKVLPQMVQNFNLFVNDFGMFQRASAIYLYNRKNNTLISYTHPESIYGINLLTADGTVYMCSGEEQTLYLRGITQNSNILLTEKIIAGTTINLIRTFANSEGRIYIMYATDNKLCVTELYDTGNYAPDLFYINDNCAQNNLSVGSLSIRSNETNIKISGIDNKLDISGPCNIPGIFTDSITTKSITTNEISLNIDCPIIFGEWSIYSAGDNLYFKYGDDFFVYLNGLGTGGQLNKTISHYTIAEDDITLYEIGKPIFSSNHVYSCKLIKKDDNILQQLESSKTTNPNFIKLQNEKETLENEINTLQEDNQILLNKYLHGELIIKEDMDEETKTEIENNLILALNIRKQMREKTDKINAINQQLSFEKINIITFEEVTNTNRENCVPSCITTGTYKTFLGIVTDINYIGDTISDKNVISISGKVIHNIIRFATHGDYLFTIDTTIEHLTTANESKLYEVGQDILYDGTIIDDDTPLTYKIKTSYIGTITKIIDENTLALFKV